ncbi:glycogen synthase [Syntrophotalea carbinolica DSM 2380]|uniref:Glycogen synthase n=1 Tax=Syntrophotalea carbinolica (strain DSM 2380 / NBRC 103641 / GraBd1) TaxID=338963 RepID=GLGA_SYNC1|nr:glycogen synthase GlgA [Syntrophotalea carbinolica]Q3A0B8.1 RecName: Full=Glycogen synthase; AltName: Full=Starch [bacterial glycogen] synthase [Syntrophotalea carbinolica DSM 2380]ABA90189.1 glycogen synthase [Syntrophotalea carbinolica DSM 2380]
MNILLAASEVAPFAKTGGLADVAGALPQELHRLGHDVRIIMPLYRSVRKQHLSLQHLGELPAVKMGDAIRTGRLWQGSLQDVPVYFLEQDDYFDRDGLYGTSQNDYPDNAERFGFFGRGLLAALPQIGFKPEILHLNDWQTGLVPALLRTEWAEDPFYAGTATMTTIHNLGYQGLFPAETVATLGLDPALYTMEGLEYYDQVSFLKSGLVYADMITTVSETYCAEIQTPQMGHGFDGILHARAARLFGVLNGIDDKLWNPQCDPALTAPYSVDDLEGKAANKRQLQKQLGLSCDADVPLLTMVTRLASQKGLDLVEQAWEQLLQRGVQLVILGSGDQDFMDRFAQLGAQHPTQTAVRLGFDDRLARLIYAGSDMFLMPSHYEPCGLGQLIALRYGSVPVVRKTGGLADTVFDPQDQATQANGFTFREISPSAMLAALDRALALYRQPEGWKQLVRRGMQGDFSWRQSALRYVELYRKAVELHHA